MKTVVGALVLAWLLAGCAATRSTLDVPVTQAPPPPTRGFVRLTEVKDVRRFEAAPSNPSVPSLQNPQDIGNASITSRAVARKRGGFGQAMADILLPEGRTVEQLVREAATRALAERGYAVVDEKSPQSGKALPLQIDIQQFWSWFSPGFLQISLEFEGILGLKGDVLSGGKEEKVRGYGVYKGMVATDSEWQEVLRLGIADLIEKMKASIKPAD